MSKSFDEVRTISKELWKKLHADPAIGSFIGNVGISKVGTFQPDEFDDEKKNYCLVVGLLNALPTHLTLDTEFQGVRVFTRIVGPVTALSQPVHDLIDLAESLSAQETLEDPLLDLAAQITPEEKAMEDKESRQRLKRALDHLFN